MSDIADYKRHTVRAATLPTTSYVNGTVIKNVELRNKVTFEITIVKQSATSFEFQFLCGDNPDSLSAPMAETVSAGVATLKPKTYTVAAADLAATDKILIGPIEYVGSSLTLAVKGTGTLTNVTVAVDALVAR